MTIAKETKQKATTHLKKKKKKNTQKTKKTKTNKKK